MLIQKGLYYSIDEEVFSRFPGYSRGVVIALGVRNQHSPEELVDLLRQAESEARERLRLEDLRDHPRIRGWREAYRAFGANPGKFRCSVEAMVRRVLRDQELPSINALVDIGNLVSLRHLVPTGGHAIDVLRGDICLRPATGEETFTAFGSDEVEHPEPGEILFVEGTVVLTRRWSWRQASHSLVLPETRAVEFNVDALPPVTPEQARAITQELARWIERFCGGEIRVDLLSRDRPRIPLT